MTPLPSKTRDFARCQKGGDVPAHLVDHDFHRASVLQNEFGAVCIEGLHQLERVAGQCAGAIPFPATSLDVQCRTSLAYQTGRPLVPASAGRFFEGVTSGANATARPSLSGGGSRTSGISFREETLRPDGRAPIAVVTRPSAEFLVRHRAVAPVARCVVVADAQHGREIGADVSSFSQKFRLRSGRQVSERVCVTGSETASRPWWPRK